MEGPNHDFFDEGEEPAGYLRETTNFLDLFLHVRNRNKAVPEVWYTWVGLSILAACVSNRVWISPEPNNPIYPNIYVILMGDSGTGKGQAISQGTRLIPPSAMDIKEMLGYFPGGTSEKALKDYLAAHPAADGLSSHAWVICSELADAVGGKDEARRLIVALTNLYTGELDTIMDNTRRWGKVAVPRACVNFLAGSTRSWFQESIGATTAEGGFIARCFIVPGQGAVRRTAKNTVAPDFATVWDHLKARLYKYLDVSGEFMLSSDGWDLLDYWMQTRPLPVVTDLMPSFNRGEVQVYKLAMLLSLADGLDLVISADHIRDAIRLYEAVKKTEIDVLDYLAAEPDKKRIDFLRDALQSAGPAGLSNMELYKSGQARGLRYGRMKELLHTLEAAGEAVAAKIPRIGQHFGRGHLHWYWGEHYLQKEKAEEEGQHELFDGPAQLDGPIMAIEGPTTDDNGSPALGDVRGYVASTPFGDLARATEDDFADPSIYRLRQ